MEIVKEASAKAAASRKRIADDFATKVKPVITAMKEQGKSLRSISNELDKLGVETARGGKWTATAVKNALDRIR